MTFLDFIAMTRRGWKILVILIVLGAAAGFGYAFLSPKVYQASSTGFIAAEGSSAIAGSDEAVARAGAYVTLISSQQVRDAIVKDAKVDPAQLSGSLGAKVVPGSTLIEVTASSASPEAALKLANGALHGLVSVIDDIESKTNNTTGTKVIIVPMDNAVAPTEPVSPNTKLAIGIGAAAGLVLAYLFLFARRALDVRVRVHTDMRDLMGTGVLARVPKLGRNGTPEGDSHNETIANEAFRQLRTGLRFSSVDNEVRVVMITSASQGEGKSMTAASLTRVMAESGQRTLIIDADLRRPKVARNFGIDGAVGLSEVLSGQVPVRSAIQPTSDPNLFVLPSGGTPPNPSEMLGSVAFTSLLNEFRKDFFIVIDAPPVLPVTDASVVSTLVDGVVFVLAVGKTRRAAGAAARTQLEQVSARILGVVLNMVPIKGADSYGDGYGYGYYRQNKSYYVRPKKTGEKRTSAAPAVVPSVPRRQTAATLPTASPVQDPRSDAAPAPAVQASVVTAPAQPSPSEAQPAPAGARGLRRSSRN